MDIESIMRRYAAKLKRFLKRRKLESLYRRYSDATMIPSCAFVDNLELMQQTLKTPSLDGTAIVECGTWRGGMSAAMVEVGGPDRDYHFFDSFEGLPPVQEIDGPAARNWQNDKAGANYHDNCSASLADFQANLARVSKPSLNTFIHNGFFLTKLFI